jgi:hypothetical protein
MAELAALARVIGLCRMLREALYELDAEIPTAQLVQELTTLQQRAENQLNQSSATEP